MKRFLLSMALALASNAPTAALADAVTLSMIYETPPPPKSLPNVEIPGAEPPPPVLAGCAVRIGQVLDMRRNKASMGAWFFEGEELPLARVPRHGRSVLSTDAQAWLMAATRTLPALGMPLDPNSGRVDIRLRLAHLWTPGAAMSAHVVLEVEGDGQPRRNFHGVSADVNWAASAGGYMQTLNWALYNALLEFVKHRQDACRSAAR